MVDASYYRMHQGTPASASHHVHPTISLQISSVTPGQGWQSRRSSVGTSTGHVASADATKAKKTMR